RVGSCRICGQPIRYSSSYPVCRSTELDLNIDASGEIKLHERVHGLVVRVDDVEYTLVRTGLVLVACILVDVRRRQSGVTLDLGREGNRAEYRGTRALSRLDDLAGGAVDQSMIVCLQPNANLLVRHNRVLLSKERSVMPERLLTTPHCPFATCPGPSRSAGPFEKHQASIDPLAWHNPNLAQNDVSTGLAPRSRRLAKADPRPANSKHVLCLISRLVVQQHVCPTSELRSIPVNPGLVKRCETTSPATRPGVNRRGAAAAGSTTGVVRQRMVPFAPRPRDLYFSHPP